VLDFSKIIWVMCDWMFKWSIDMWYGCGKDFGGACEERKFLIL
jgi:hypothetical protein